MVVQTLLIMLKIWNVLTAVALNADFPPSTAYSTELILRAQCPNFPVAPGMSVPGAIDPRLPSGKPSPS